MTKPRRLTRAQKKRFDALVAALLQIEFWTNPARMNLAAFEQDLCRCRSVHKEADEALSAHAGDFRYN